MKKLSLLVVVLSLILVTTVSAMSIPTEGWSVVASLGKGPVPGISGDWWRFRLGSGDYTVNAYCVQPELPNPPIGARCSYNPSTNRFWCGDAVQELIPYEVIETPAPTPTFTPTNTPTETPTPTPTETPTSTPTEIPPTDVPPTPTEIPPTEAPPTATLWPTPRRTAPPVPTSGYMDNIAIHVVESYSDEVCLGAFCFMCLSAVVIFLVARKKKLS